MKIEVIGLTPGFDRADPRNAGVSADELVGPGGGGAMLRRVAYTDAKGTTYKYLTHNLMLLLEDEIEKGDGISNIPEKECKSEREEEARESGGATWRQ